LDIPAFLKIPPEERRAAWETWKGFPDQGKPILDDRGPGSVARRLGYTDGINRTFVAELQAREAAERVRKRQEGLARLAAWKAGQAEIAAIKTQARKRQSEFQSSA
jgi:hypothetical protein